MPQCIINRRAAFSASHRYWLPEISDAENRQRFGKSSNFPGHGHNYELFVAMKGEIDPVNGMVLNLSTVKHTIHREVISDLNFSYLNHAWQEFEQCLPTTENIARVIWQRLSNHLPLVNIQLYEHPELWADYQGNSMQAHLTVKSHFAAAHRLALENISLLENTALYGKCARPNGHGHNYHIEITVSGEIDKRSGMLIDLEKFQEAIDTHVLEPLDHTFLNYDIPYFSGVVPTAENIAVFIQNALTEPIRELGAELHRVKLIESPNNSCEVYGPGVGQSNDELLTRSIPTYAL